MIRRHINYGKYLLRHKWYVTLACFQRGLFWRGLKHDLSKFFHREWFPYANFHYNPDGSKKQIRDKTGYYKPSDTGDPAFDYAWMHHFHHNDHHWQHWCVPEAATVVLKVMPEKAIQEMVCDWIGAARAQGVENWQDPSPWFKANQGSMRLHMDTRFRIIEILVAIREGLPWDWRP